MPNHVALSQDATGIRFAVIGCGHGVLHSIYSSIKLACQKQTPPWDDVDLVIIGGDFQAVRNAYDLRCVSMPAKYRAMQDFHEYYSGNRTAPYLTLYVGGNHEAVNYSFELGYGGWVAKNIYYMGWASVVKFGPLRIAGISGIWKGFDYRKPHNERLPYSEDDIKSAYHVRESDVRKLSQIRTQIDICISHDWPRDIVWQGDAPKLFRRKPFLREDAESGQLGSVAAKQLLDLLRPKLWFSAHLHCKHAALMRHDENQLGEQSIGVFQHHASKSSPQPEVKNKDEIELDLDLDSENDAPAPKENGGTASDKDRDERAPEYSHQNNTANSPFRGQAMDDARAALPAAFYKRESTNKPTVKHQFVHPPKITNTATQFLALAKCVPHQDFLQLIELPTLSDTSGSARHVLQHDREWLAITRAFALHEPLELPSDASGQAVHPPFAKSQAEYAALIDEQLDWIDDNLTAADMIISPGAFEITAPVYDGGDIHDQRYAQENGGLKEYTNPQTKQYCEMLQIPCPFDMDEEQRARRMASAASLAKQDRGARQGGNRGNHNRGWGKSGRGSRVSVRSRYRGNTRY